MSASITGFTIMDLLQPEILENPYPLFRSLRRDSPVHWDAKESVWIVSRYEDV